MYLFVCSWCLRVSAGEAVPSTRAPAVAHGRRADLPTDSSRSLHDMFTGALPRARSWAGHRAPACPDCALCPGFLPWAPNRQDWSAQSALPRSLPWGALPARQALRPWCLGPSGSWPLKCAVGQPRTPRCYCSSCSGSGSSGRPARPLPSGAPRVCIYFLPEWAEEAGLLRRSQGRRAPGVPPSRTLQARRPLCHACWPQGGAVAHFMGQGGEGEQRNACFIPKTLLEDQGKTTGVWTSYLEEKRTLKIYQ